MLESFKAKGKKFIKGLSHLGEISENRQVLKYGMPAILFLLLINTIQVARFNMVIGPLTHYSEGLVDDLGAFRQDMVSFGEDLNEMRSFLLLPTKNYSFTANETEEISEDQKATTKTEQALYLYLGNFVSERKTAANIERVRALTTALPKNEALGSGLKELGLTTGKLNTAEEALTLKIGTLTENYFEVLGDLTTGTLILRDALGGSVPLKGADEVGIAQEILAQTKTVKNKIDTVRQTTARNQTLIEEALKDDELLKLLDSKKLLIPNNPETRIDSSTYQIQNQDGAVILTLTIGREDGKIRINDAELAEDDALSSTLIEAVRQLDGTTDAEKRVAQTRTELEGILNEAAFKELLASGGLSTAAQPREAYNQLLYDVTSADGKVQFSFVIELSSGAVKVLKDDSETDLLSVLEQNAKKKL